ncbi:MAG: 4'-phosphopantetheinyl transferase superfamily protein, partial [Candidatus Marinimicrobia bacterium]|nr:4'-phosphopantetheinyl transferase superfamily protein [Candidatus Neomarinimicrobiota bacterium]
MKINGIGVDIVENKRIKKLINNKQFISRIFSKKEINQSKKIKNKTILNKLLLFKI